MRTADQVFAIFGFDLKFVPERWCGLGAWLDGMRGGWKPELILLAARMVMKQRKGVPPGSFCHPVVLGVPC
jgi:hypothetical protein